MQPMLHDLNYLSMKKFLNIFLLSLLSMSLLAQVPKSMNYQSVVRDATGKIVIQQIIGIQASILQGSVNGASVYSETFTKTTNDQGLVNLAIGTGTSAGLLSDIDWSAGPYFMQVAIDISGGTNYLVVGTSEILSVPYAFMSDTTASYAEIDPVFNVSVASAITGADTTYWNNKTDTETDPVYSGSVASGITGADINFWNNKLDTEVDGSVTNELQTLSVAGTDLSISNGNSVSLSTLSPWTPSGADIYFSGGAVGIGVTTPGAMLHINTTSGLPFLKFESNDNVYTQWTTSRLGADSYLVGIDGGNNRFMFANLTTGGFPVIIQGNNVGLGTLLPERPLHVKDVMRLEPRSTVPLNPKTGDIYMDDGTNTTTTKPKLRVYDGTNWYECW